MDNKKLTPEQEKARWDALTPAQKGAETKARKAAEKAAKEAKKNVENPNPNDTTEKPKDNKGGENKKDKKEEKKDVKPVTDKDGFLNPLQSGVSYKDFSKVLGEQSVASYCAGKLEKHEIDWLTDEIEKYKKLQKK